MNLADGSFWIYEYDSLGQVKSGKRYWNDWTPVAGQQFEYGFDDIGNRTGTKTGGDAAGASLRTASYTNNSLNQITGRDVPSYLNVIGAATATATNVNVNNTMAYRRGEYYRVELNPNNSSAVWQSVTNRAVQNGTTNSVTGNVYLPKHAEVFSYDADGNLTNDGRWAYVWDGENRLVRMFAPTTAPSGSVKALQFSYDWRGRRISKTASNYSGSAWSKVLDEKHIYDGWNLLSSLNASNNAVVYAFLWGSDLSGSMQGAGGVGGLLTVNAKGVSVTFAAYDGNGNVTALANAADGTTLATYEYGPFGEVIRCPGSAAKTNPFRFSTKFQDDETDLLYYGYRYLGTSIGRWPNRDPLGEPGFEAVRGNRASALSGGPNRYLFVQNNPISRWDYLGLDNPDCDIPPGIKDSAIYKSNADCFRRCCAQHDQCYYRTDCTASSWVVNALQVASSQCGRYGKILTCGLAFHPCVRCNNAAVECFAKCACGLGPSTGPRWFCPNGKHAGEFFDNWDDMPADCWEDGKKPDRP